MFVATYRPSFYAAWLLIASVFANCKVAERDIPAIGNAGTLKVQMLNVQKDGGLVASYLYILGGCLPDVNGVLQENDTVTFTSPGMKNGLKGCSVKVKTNNPAPGVQFAPEQEGVLYTANLTDVFLDLQGALAAKAPLTPLYKVQQSPTPSTITPVPQTEPIATPALPTADPPTPETGVTGLELQGDDATGEPAAPAISGAPQP